MINNIWIVRHGERIDNIDDEWKNNAPRGAWDDPTITERGHQQAKEVGKKLAKENVQIDHMFVSPFIRCVQTANNIINEIKKNNLSLLIKIEPGFSEALDVCQQPPGILSVKELKKEFKYIDDDYIPFIHTKNLPIETTAFCCFKRVRDTLSYIIQKYSGNILIVSHASPILACHGTLTKKFFYVGQCTISKYRIKDKNVLIEKNNSIKLLKNNYICEFVGDSNHLSDKTNLRDNIVINKADKLNLMQAINSL